MKTFLVLVYLSVLLFLSINSIVVLPVSAQEKVRIGISSLGPGFIPSIVAEKKGLYRKYGLSTEHIVISLAIAMNALGTGDLDYAESIAQGITAAARGFPVKLVMFIQDHMDMMLIARPEIKTVADLRGKTVAISYPGSTSQLVAETILKKSGLEPGTDVQLLPSGGSQSRMLALETRRAVAAVQSTPYNRIGANKGYPVLVWAKDYLATPLNGVIVTDKKIREARDQVKRFIKGTIEGLQYVREHKNESLDIASKWMRLDRDTTKAMTDVVFPMYSPDGTMSDEAIRIAIETELKRGKMEKKLSFNDVADRSVLLEAQKELGLR